MNNGNDSSGSDDEQSPSQPAFNWGLTPSEAAADEPGLLKLPDLVLPDSDPTPAGPPSPTEPPPTEALSMSDLPTGLMDVADLPTGLMDVADIPAGGDSGPPTEAMNAADLPTAAITAAGPEDESVEHDAVGALFGDEQFVEYEEEPLRGALVPAVISRPREPQAPRPPIPRGQLFAISIAAGLVAALALTALFLGGTKIGEAATPAAVATPVPTDTASSAPAVGPLPAGTYGWDELLGGECLDPFDSAWQDEYTVVECAQPHAAQLLVRGKFDDAVSAPFPEVDELVARTTSLCSTDVVINFVAAQSFSDFELVASFAPNADTWEAGQREYYCFATRSGDDALTESVAQPQAAAKAEGE